MKFLDQLIILLCVGVGGELLVEGILYFSYIYLFAGILVIDSLIMWQMLTIQVKKPLGKQMQMKAIERRA